MSDRGFLSDDVWAKCVDDSLPPGSLRCNGEVYILGDLLAPPSVHEMTRTLVADFIVKGEPVAKQRARIVNGHSYTPAKTVDAEELMQWAYVGVRSGYIADRENSFVVEASFFCGNKRRKDVDNLLKLCLDALNGVAWKDDSQVTEIFARKSFVPKADARTVVQIWRISE
jgi:Holliday junction resolvase RusA-like endonuclease